MVSLATAVLSLFAAISTADSPVITFEVAIPQPQTHLFEVRMEIGGLAKSELDLSMPVWIPGSYLVREFERHVVTFAAEDGAGRPLAWRKVDKNTWKVQTGGAERIVAKYEVYGGEPGIRWSFVYDEGGHIIGVNLFMHPVGYADSPASVRFDLPDGWALEGGIAPAAGDPYLIKARSYHELIDTPMMIGRFRSATFEVDGITHIIALLGPSDADLDKLAVDVKKVVEACRDLFGELPYERYIFAWTTVSNGGGIEHANGTSLGTDPWGFGEKVHYHGFLNLVAHEFLHTWNVKRIQPPAFRPYGYEEEVYTDSLWWYEGGTTYLDGRIMVLAGFDSQEDYLAGLARQIGIYRTAPGRLVQSAAESSFDAWIKEYRADENSVNSAMSYYTKGSFVGLLLDLEIAKRSGGKWSLENVIRTMWRRTREEGASFGTGEIRALCEQVAGGSLQEIFDKYVCGTDEVPFEEYFAYAGYELSSKEAKEGERKGHLGITTRQAGGKLTVQCVYRDRPAWRGGLNSGDEILAVNDIRVADYASFAQQLGRYKPGEEMELLVARHCVIRSIKVTLGESPRHDYEIKEIEEPTGEQKAVRERWLPKPPESEEEK